MAFRGANISNWNWKSIDLRMGFRGANASHWNGKLTSNSLWFHHSDRLASEQVCDNHRNNHRDHHNNRYDHNINERIIIIITKSVTIITMITLLIAIIIMIITMIVTIITLIIRILLLRSSPSLLWSLVLCHLRGKSCSAQNFPITWEKEQKNANCFEDKKLGMLKIEQIWA